MSDLSDLLSPGGGGGGDEIAEDARSTAGSERSTSSARSGIPKFSGSQSRPGSRIGQATGASSKFALPPTGCSTPKIGSTATTSSMDALWDLHPRKLSEAGLSRHSDNSTVLTEDTDSFIIGQRVWVGGSKPGQIAYIGETQFAPGEWAGIVLDQPIGKNDGSVGGIRYFQCESKKGVFSRLTRLTRYPMIDSVDCTTPSPTNGTRRNVVSPSMSTRSALSKYINLQSKDFREQKLSILGVSNTSLASTFVDFKVGERVIIKSSQGSKIGTLRYMGFTSFANGEWCGVELDEPRGKNDGSVEGKRYFECRPNYGLFAPVSKVSRSPSNRKPRGNCALHNSRESLLSLSSITSATSTARRVRLGVTSLTPKVGLPFVWLVLHLVFK
ncbi:PREDICTED: restin homolog isoform X2 [Nicrophorus vespilloides]|uniref:Restin homolog isoform X2 n=1 Tax=Nicrophorus vespilloides TaxID=110193 RepID=A0ABM1MFX4_NICVS|nr:PREDICTED: restin homolog isoform X2 [Nicrophorus vespilloides]